MKDHELYPIYLYWLSTLNKTNGELSLFKISEFAFNNFCSRCGSDSVFVDTLKIGNRDITIGNILE
jgi:hypothetical protein